MRYSELFEKPQIGMAKKAWTELPVDAQEAIKSWERSAGYSWVNNDGSRHWVLPELEQHFRANDAVAQVIERTFAPIRAALPPIIKLYRGLTPGIPYNPDRILESWTDTLKDAELFANYRSLLDNGTERFPSRFTKEITDQQIASALATYNKLGYVTVNGRAYVRNKEHPQYYDIYSVASLDNRGVQNASPEKIQRYKDNGWDANFASRNHSHITDGDNLEKELRDRQSEIAERNKNIRAKGQIITRETPREKIIWITNNLGSKEYIVQK